MIPAVVKSTTGRYVVQEGDTSSRIANKLYADVRKAPTILHANPHGWEPGDVIDVPGFTGFLLTVQPGEQFTRLYRRAFSSVNAAANAKEEFFKWNGRWAVEPGDDVFFVDLMKKSWGY